MTRAEVLYSFYIIEHNLLIACAGHAGVLIIAVFPDSKITSKYACAQTETAADINVMAKTTSENIAERCVSLDKETLLSLLIEKVDSCSSGTACYEKSF